MKIGLTILLLTVVAMNSKCQVCPKMFIEAQYKKQYYPLGNGLAQQYAVIGMYREALAEDDRFLSGKQMSILPENGIEAVPALPLITKAIKENDIVILNERHTMPNHRLLLYNIVDSLKRYSVDAVFLEALGYTPEDSIIYKGTPTMSWGIYTSENVYNQALRKLLRNGIDLYSYEKSTLNFDTITTNGKTYIISKTKKTWESIEADTSIISQLFSDNSAVSRDIEQALKIYQKLKKNNIKKAFIYCGGNHEWKAQTYMAGALRHLLKKDLYVIDQIILNEHSNKTLEDPLYQKYANSSVPLTLKNRSGQLLHTVSTQNDTADFLIDMVVVTPRTIYKNNRPTWLELNGDRKRYPLSNFINTKEISSDCLVLLYDESDEKLKGGDGIEFIPTDAFQVQGNPANYDAILFPNKRYHLVVYKDGAIAISKYITTNE